MGLKSFIDVSCDSHFPLENLPFGIFRPKSTTAACDSLAAPPRPGIAIGDFVLDLSAIADAGLFNGPALTNNSRCFFQPSLNMFLEMGRTAWKEARSTIQKLLSADEPTLRDNANLRERAILPMSEVQMLLPIVIGDFTDFSCSKQHTEIAGIIFSGPNTSINPDWFLLPTAYHGRASSVGVSGTDIIRPRGYCHPNGNSPYFGPSQKLDFELEMAAVVGPGNDLGKPVDVNEAANHIFGLLLLNDWTAMDISAWELLGPFQGKSFCTTISPWIVTLEALESFACDAPKQEPQPLPYLNENKHINYNILLEAWIKPSGHHQPSLVTKSNFNHLYWSLTQLLAHQTINGCNLRPGDLLGTGTISGPDPESYGCLLALTWDAQKPLNLNGSTRTFLEDGDEVILTAYCKGKDYIVGFGTCSGKILPAISCNKN